MRELHRVAARPESSAREPLSLRNGVSACSRNFFPAIPDSSGKISNSSGKKVAWNFAGRVRPAKEVARNFAGRVHLAKEVAVNFPGRVRPSKEVAVNFPGRVRPAKGVARNCPGRIHPARKAVRNFQEQAGIFAARFIARRDRFGIAKKKLQVFREHQVPGAQKPVCRAQACPAKHPDGYRETLFRRP